MDDTIRFDVTDEDSRRGIRYFPSFGPITRAFRRARPKASHIFVDPDTGIVSWDEDGESYEASLPADTYTAMMKFCLSGEFPPMTITLADVR